jgi:propanol-preferring alcohol dehydrogenase
VQLSKAMGFRPIVIDTGEEKKKLSLEMGAEAFIDFKETSDIPDAVKKIADGIGPHSILITAPPAYKGAVELVGDRIGATIVCIGLPPAGMEAIGADPFFFILKNLTLKGSLVGTMDDTRRALDYAKRGLLKQICEVYPIDRLPEAVDKLRKGQVAGRMVVDFNQ